MAELSVFADESGEIGTESKYYLLTLVFHEQDVSLDRPFKLYEESIRDRALPRVPMHACTARSNTRLQRMQSFTGTSSRRNSILRKWPTSSAPLS